jgi:superfamily II DNA or RNA helicase
VFDHLSLEALIIENQRLIALLELHGIAWKKIEANAPSQQIIPKAEQKTISVAEKIRLFRQRFRGREDVFPVRWESKTTGKSGYSPVCANEWRASICQKPRIKCSDCAHRQYLPITDDVVYRHLSGEATMGVYALCEDDRCHFLAVDFDDEQWRDDAQSFVSSCRQLDIPAALEVSRSGQGAHVWIFFSSSVLARDARRLGSALISYTCSQTRQLQLSSYDRLFPNQDTMPKGGLGNLIALPLQKKPREQGFSVFVDEQFLPYPDQWSFLASVDMFSEDKIEAAIVTALGHANPLDITFIEDEVFAKPWQLQPKTNPKPFSHIPSSVTITLANFVYFEKEQLPQPLTNRLIRLAAFQNPEFYKAQSMRMSVWDKPRIIGCAQNFPKHIALPRGCFDAAQALLDDLGIKANVNDERFFGELLEVSFLGQLRKEQQTAVTDMLKNDVGVLCAPTAFGKTVTAAAMIAKRGVNTLILVHRTELLKQWQQRLQVFLQLNQQSIGVIGAGKHRLTGIIDIAVMQSLSRMEEINTLIEGYGHIIVDECHHIGAASFDAILMKAKARFVMGLTATPIRRDGLHPIIFMQCGPIRHLAKRSETMPTVLTVKAKYIESAIAVQENASIQDIFKSLTLNQNRTDLIAEEIVELYRLGRKQLVLTERTEHLAMIVETLGNRLPIFVLHGKMGKKQRDQVIETLNNLDSAEPMVLVATGKLVGEGFDYPPLDTLVLAMPISWKGTLQQYVGRLHREHSHKSDVLVVDFVDTTYPMLMRMWDKRQQGYRLMGYIETPLMST